MKKKDRLYIIISAFVVVVCWIIFNIVHTTLTSTIPEALSIQIIPIKATFNEPVIESLKQRKQVQPLNKLPVITTGTPSPSSPISTASAVPSVAPQATTGGILQP